MRAATSLGRWLRRAGRDEEARAVVTEPYRKPYRWFTEGLETRDLRSAREVLEGPGAAA